MQFKGLAVSKRLWEYIQGTKAFLTEPIPPTVDSFRRLGATTRSQSSSTPAPEEANPFGNMTAEGQKSFQLAWAVYLDQDKKFTYQIDGIDKLKEWVRKTASPNYQLICCEPTDTIKDWYEKLKELVSTEERTRKREARDKYRRAIKPPTNLKSLSAWITNWELVMSEAKKKGLAVAENSSDWFDDCLNAIEPLLPSWVDAYRLTKETEAETENFSYRMLANDIREVVRRKVIPSKSTKIAKGSFGPSFAGEENSQCAGVDVPNQGDGQTLSKGKQRSGKIAGKRKQSEDKSPSSETCDKSPSHGKPVCRGCKQFHYFRRCFYLFPEIAPEWFTERTELREIVNQSIQDDPTLAEEVKRMKKKMEKSTSEHRNEQE